MGTFLLLLLVCGLIPALADEEQKIYKVGRGVREPILLRKVEPTYSPGASVAGVQGAVLLDLVVNAKGRVQDIVILSPLGFGLDENAIDAVRQWQFKPATKDGKPVAVKAEIQVFFRVLGGKTDISMERERTQFNMAIQRIQQKDPGLVKRGVDAIKEASEAKYAPAMYLEGVLRREGRLLPKDDARTKELIEYAADRKYGPAMSEVAKMYLTGQGKPADKEKGLELLRSSAALGSVDGQFLIGQLYETGNGLPQDLAQARKYYRLCAAQGEGMCQERLAGLLTRPQRTERDYVQALAWLQLASEQGLDSARKKFEDEKGKASKEELEQVAKLKSKLVKRQFAYNVNK